jgi:RNA-directed DNA polymerase
VDQHTTRLLRAQGGRCPSCGEFLLHADHEPRSPLEWEQWFITVRTFYRLLHATCQRRLTTAKAAHQS